jgi:hypothetical protein
MSWQDAALGLAGVIGSTVAVVHGIPQGSQLACSLEVCTCMERSATFGRCADFILAGCS